MSKTAASYRAKSMALQPLKEQADRWYPMEERLLRRGVGRQEKTTDGGEGGGMLFIKKHHGGNGKKVHGFGISIFNFFYLLYQGGHNG